jgi:putative ABC transport system permease protein
MTLASLRSLMARRTRAALTALAIVLGVAMIAGSLILTDTIDRAFTDIFGSSYTNTDLVVRGTPAVDDAFAGAPTVPASLLPRIQEVPGVAEAGGTLVDFSGTGNIARMLDRDGEVIGGNMPTFGFGVDPAHPRFNPLTLAEGAWATGPDQVVIDVTTATDHGFAVGDTIRVVGDGPARAFTVTGIARFGDVDSLGGATIAVFDIATAREVLGKSGFDAIQVAAEPGVAEDVLAARIEAVIPDTVRVRTGDEQAAADKQVISEAVAFIRGVLLAFGGIALFVGAFVIFNTLSITVAQRSRELATLRTLGASRRQVLRSVIGEAGIIGLIASLAGLALGLGLAAGLSALFRAMGLDMPQGDTVFSTSTVVVSLLVGTLVTLLAGVVPAIRATRVPPILAVREGASPTARGSRRRGPATAVAATLVAGAMLVRGLLADDLGAAERLLMLGGGALALFVGIAVISSRLVRPIAALVGWPVARAGVAGELARENTVRNPSRTAATAAALMIGLALVTLVSVLGAGLIGTARSDVTDQVTATHVVTSSNGWEPVPQGAGRAVAAAQPGALVSSVREDRAVVEGEPVPVSGVDPATIGRAYAFSWTSGSPDALDALARGGAVVARTFAEDHGLAVGSAIRLTTPSGTTFSRVVAGVYDPPRLMPVLNPVVVSQAQFDAAFPRPKDRYTFVAGAEDGTAGIERALAGFPDTRVATAEAFARATTSDLSTILNMLYVLLALSVVVSVFGMVNTLVLAVHERTREIGMLRAVGMTRRQTRRMVRGESVVTALIGAAVGIPLGIGIAALVTRSLSEWGVRLEIPVASLLAFAAVAVAVGVIAAVAPARRAARIDVLRAVQYE